MKKTLLCIVCLVAMMAAGTGLRAQQPTITLNPGWNWISYPEAVAMEIEMALGSFVPVEGDIVKSQFGFSIYQEGQWQGSFTHFMPGMGYMYCSSRSEVTNFFFANASSSAVATATPTEITTTSAVVGGMVTLPTGSHVFLRGVCWGMEPNPDIDGNHTSNATGVGSYSDTLVDLNPNTTYYVRAYVVSDYGLAYGNALSFTTESDGGGEHEYVDLGLPSGLLWATCNVGANAPEDYGDYFAWGETEPKDYYNWSTYQYCMGNENALTRYCNNSSYGNNGFADNLSVLLFEDDAATANWGSDWRMPTFDEWEELYNYTSYTYTTRNGVNGMLFTASNGNSLFLPAAGYCDGSSFYNEGSSGHYWSSSLETGSLQDAWFLYFGSGIYIMGNYYRYFGETVRAVRSGIQDTTFVVNAVANPPVGGTVRIQQEGQNCTLTATANANYTFTNWTENGEVVSTDANYSFAVNGNRILVANFVLRYVDLGLPSGLLWATCNVGADSPEDYGDYFAWGETQPKDTYSWSTYQYCNGSNNTLTKYCNNSSYGYNGFTDNLTTLQPSDDAATANWGSDCRMPTKEEWQELYQNTTHTWTTQNGVNGRLFTATNGNSLFLPAAGDRWDSELSSAGSNGHYWSRSLYTDTPDGAWSLYFYSVHCSMHVNSYRNNGFSVRPVRQN